MADGGDTAVEETLRRCSCCEVRRPLWAFTKKTQTERNGVVGNYHHNACRACSSGSSPPQMAKRAGEPLMHVQSLANDALDRIRANELRGQFDMSQHRPEEKREVLPDIVKMCRICEEEMPHARAGRARFEVKLLSCESACRGCRSASLDAKPWREMSLDRRRGERTDSIRRQDELARRLLTGERWCSPGRHWSQARCFSKVAAERYVGKSRTSGSCRSCTSLSARSSASPHILIDPTLRDADNERRYQAWLSKQSSKADAEAQIDLESIAPTHNPPARHAPAPLPLAPRAVRPKDETEVITHPTRRVSKGAVRRAEKRERWAKEDADRAARVLTDADFVELSEDEAVEIGVLAIRSAAQRTQGRVRTVVKRDPWRAVQISRAEIRVLIRKAVADGQKFYRRPSGWHGDWPFRPSPDKIDTRGGYLKDNLRYVPWIANRARGADAIPVFERWLKDCGALRGDVAGLTDDDLAAECARRGLRDPRQLDLFG